MTISYDEWVRSPWDRPLFLGFWNSSSLAAAAARAAVEVETGHCAARVDLAAESIVHSDIAIVAIAVVITVAGIALVTVRSVPAIVAVREVGRRNPAHPQCAIHAAFDIGDANDAERSAIAVAILAVA